MFTDSSEAYVKPRSNRAKSHDIWIQSFKWDKFRKDAGNEHWKPFAHGTILLSTLKYYIIYIYIHILLNLHLELSQVSYCENDVDCRRLIQLVHFGEKFDSSTCQKTCDNCVKVTSFIEKDVTEIAKQLVWIKSYPYIIFIPLLHEISLVCNVWVHLFSISTFDCHLFRLN